MNDDLDHPYRDLKPEHAAGMAASVIAAILFLVMVGAGIVSMVGTFYRDAGW